MRPKTEEQQNLNEMIKQVEWDLFITLTFNRKRSQIEMTDSLKSFFMFVERKVFGRQKMKRLLRVAVFEETAESNHVHLLMKKPEFIKHAIFREILSDKWKKVRFSGWNNLRKNNESWYESINDTREDRNNVAFYSTKHVDKDYASVDFQNMVLTSV